jgi:hypothetical protein
MDTTEGVAIGGGRPMMRGARQILTVATAAAFTVALAACGGSSSTPVSATPTATTPSAPTPTQTPAEPPCSPECQENCGTGSSCGCFGHAPDCLCGLPSFDCPNGRYVLCSQACKNSCEQETSAPNSRATCNGIPFSEIDAQSMRGATQTITYPSCRDCVWCCAPPA